MQDKPKLVLVSPCLLQVGLSKIPYIFLYMATSLFWKWFCTDLSRLKFKLSCLFFLSPLFSIFPSADQENTTTLIPATHNTGGSLPDLTNIHFPSPLPTPLDPEESTFPALSSSNSTGNLAANLTHLGISTASQGKITILHRFNRLSIICHLSYSMEVALLNNTVLSEG